MVKSRIEPTIFLIEKISFSLKLFSGYFYGQSFIKTVRGPLLNMLGKRDKMRGISFETSLIFNSVIQEHEFRSYLSHDIKIAIWHENVNILPLLRNVKIDVNT